MTNSRSEARADDFRGDTPHLIASIDALLDLDDAKALVPHGLGGEGSHAYRLLCAARQRLAAFTEPAAAMPSKEQIAQLLLCRLGPIGEQTRLQCADDLRALFSPSHSGETGEWVRIPKPTLEDLAAIGEAAEGAMLSEKGWAEIGNVVWDLITTDAEVTDWSSAIRSKFYSTSKATPNDGGRDDASNEQREEGNHG